MEKAGLISTWYDMLIDIGSNWDEKIEYKLRNSDIIILLISDNFFASEYIWNKELPIIEEKIENESAIVIPILCRHCSWVIREPFASRMPDSGKFEFNISSLQGLPIKDSKLMPIHSEAFKYIDEAYAQIAEKLQLLIQKGISGLKDQE